VTGHLLSSNPIQRAPQLLGSLRTRRVKALTTVRVSLWGTLTNITKRDLVVKAVSEEGVRLNIRKATLREWGRDFARHLRAQGISANATNRAVRGTTRENPSDGMYRAMQRDASPRTQERAASSAMKRLTASESSNRESLLHTRAQVEWGWSAAAEMLDRHGQRDLAWSVRRFADALPPSAPIESY
jgi:hypothetical protein